jgi:hypothetical protein
MSVQSGHQTCAHWSDWGHRAVRCPWFQPNEGLQLLAWKGVINMCCSALGWLSWNSNWSNTLVSLCKHLPLSGTSDRLSCGFLVTLDGCCHLDGLEQLGVVEEDWWLFFAYDRLILWRGTWSRLAKSKRGYSSNLLVARRIACGSDSCNTQDVGLACDAN